MKFLSLFFKSWLFFDFLGDINCSTLYFRFQKYLKKGRLTASEKDRIVAGLSGRKSLVDLAKELGRDRRTLSSFVKNPNTKSIKDKDSRRKLSSRDLRKIRRQVMKQSCNTSAAIFDKAGVPSVSRQTRCNVLNDIAKNIKHIARHV